VFYKARIGSRKPGTKIKRYWNWACMLKRPPVRLSVQGLVPTRGCTLGARFKCYFNTIHQFNPFLQNPQQQLNSFHKSEIMNTQGYHQQQYLITTTTSIKHDFINNPSTTIHSLSFMGKTQVYMYIQHKHVKFNINNLIIFNSYTQTLHPNISTNFTN